MHISEVVNAAQIFRVVNVDGHIGVYRGDHSKVLPLGPLDGPEARAVIEKIEGPFTTAREAEDRVVAAVRGWQDRSRERYYTR